LEQNTVVERQQALGSLKIDVLKNVRYSLRKYGHSRTFVALKLHFTYEMFFANSDQLGLLGIVSDFR